jgi:FtsZ-interacting cell division protein ZipA
MSELHLTLIGIGAALLLAVWGFNRFQEWRWHRMARSTLGSERPDVLLGELPPGAEPEAPPRRSQPGEEPPFQPHGGAPAEPAPSFQPTSDLSAQAGLHAAIPAHPDEPAFSPEAPPAAPAVLVEAVREELYAPPDEDIEYLVTLGCTAPISGAELWQHLARATAPARGARWVGRRVTDGGWNVVLADSEQRFDSLRAALLLANRAGPVSELDLERFCSLVSAVATTLQLRAEFPPRAPALQRAEALDAFCAEVDIVVGINVVTPGGQPVPAARIARWAENHAMVLGRDGAFHLRNAQDHTVWRLVNRDPRPFTPAGLGQMTVSGVTFLLDVPLVDAAAERLSPMFDAAATLARELGARVLDDNGAPLGPQQLGRIAQELGTLLNRMESEAIPAGGERARRLFSS